MSDLSIQSEASSTTSGVTGRVDGQTLDDDTHAIARTSLWLAALASSQSLATARRLSASFLGTGPVSVGKTTTDDGRRATSHAGFSLPTLGAMPAPICPDSEVRAWSGRRPGVAPGLVILRGPPHNGGPNLGPDPSWRGTVPTW
jgi:hypothetical protein